MQGLAALAALARAVPSDAKDLLHVNCPHKFCSFSDAGSNAVPLPSLTTVWSMSSGILEMLLLV